MELRVFRSGKGDCLLVSGGDGKTILADGGVLEAYEDHWAEFVGDLRDGGQSIDVVYVSHIDRDHIGGILRMLDNEVAWRIFDYQSSLPAHLRTKTPKEPTLPRPPEVKAIWHNAFFETVQTDVLSSSLRATGAAIDMISVLSRSAAILGGASPDSELFREASHHQFLGQSVGDAIEVSRRIRADQLNIPLNPDFEGNFMIREADRPDIQIGAMRATVLGPTKEELKALLGDWNKWITDKSDYLKKLIRRHEDEARHLPSASPERVLEVARERALELASNQTVTPPNLASLIVLLREGQESILLTGDADDTSIIEGCEEAGLFDNAGRLHVKAFKIPHHGAHNSYSDDLARRITADHYVFCGNGKHSNPEKDIVESYLKVLLEGHDGHEPAAPSGAKFTLWFNCGEKLASSDLKQHWKNLEKMLDRWSERFPGRFKVRFLKTGDSFVIK